GPPRQLLVGHRPDRLDRESPDPREVVVDVVLGQAQLVGVAAERLGRDSGLRQGPYRPPHRSVGSILAFLPAAERAVDQPRPARSEAGSLHAVSLGASHARRPSSASSSRDVSPHAPSSSSLRAFRSKRGSARPTISSPTSSGRT